jgi:Asp/Glu/hydantoin racemase
MSERKLGLLHTSATLVPIFEKLCKEKLPEVSVFNLVDDSLIKDVIAHGELRPKTARRVVQHIAAAEDAGADYILVTCSSIGAAVEAAANLTAVPVLRVDQPMADHAVSKAHHIGVIATLPTTLKPTADLLRRRGVAAGKNVELTTRLCDGAFEALMSGDTKTHDALVVNALRELSSDVELIALAQASMARIVSELSEHDRRVPILASPPMAIDYLATVLK